MSEQDYLKDELEAIKLSIANEIKVRDFYLEHAGKIKNKLAKKTFIFLADEELRHIDEIKAFDKAIHDGAEPTIESGTEDEAINRSREFFSTSAKAMAEKVVAEDDDIKVYELGLEMELKGYDFYKQAAEKAEHPNVKNLFEFLMKEENAHYALISNAINYLKSPDDFFQEQESWFFEG
ncbi:MAG: ferritin family protein [Nanoarchaeota archaeon]|nr:ferritin family protein [Nanoarchaeota archaeon]MBU1322272.1 ferritin family protein [Nanoarchaeota archaeon]MBU1598025.1 ferritin family protein [Nanoarchaeota archaeon]MBU2441009.1 ferritin family protein [Nanoarchaeota archaeon]